MEGRQPCEHSPKVKVYGGRPPFAPGASILVGIQNVLEPYEVLAVLL